jgi:hypothetical protein
MCREDHRILAERRLPRMGLAAAQTLPVVLRGGEHVVARAEGGGVHLLQQRLGDRLPETLVEDVRVEERPVEVAVHPDQVAEEFEVGELTRPEIVALTHRQRERQDRPGGV